MVSEPLLADAPTLIEEFRRTRDPDLFRQLVEAYQDRVFRLVSSILGPWADLDAEAVTQDVFLRVFRKIGQFHGEAAFGSWLYRVAHNTAINHRRKARIRLPHGAEEELAVIASAADPLGDALSAQDRSVIARHLEALPATYRTLVYLHYWKEASMAEISAMLEIPTGTVKSYLSRARARLRAGIEEANRA